MRIILIPVYLYVGLTLTHALICGVVSLSSGSIFTWIWEHPEQAIGINLGIALLSNLGAIRRKWREYRFRKLD